LIVFKYAGFITANLGRISGADFSFPELIMPIGISFYTFQILSYVIDLYRGRISVQKNLIDFATYVVLFPQLVAGPIVRYSDVAGALSHREHSVARAASGIRRFIVGLGKKVLVANVLGELAAIASASGEDSVLFAWLYIVAFTLQIYFDFSGYSDMAIGMGRIFGFDFPENFNYPYIAKNITEFWRRWHISLSSWFRDYLYIPLGGSRVSPARHIFNILFVWMLTGFWHGAAWNFLAWGLYYGLVLLLEKYLIGKWLSRAPSAFSHIYAMFVIVIAWVFFDAASFADAGNTLSQMFGFGVETAAGPESLYYLVSYALPLAAGILLCTPLPKRVAHTIRESKYGTILEPVALAAVLIVSTAFLANSSFNPFIYFRF
jgi:alginate O-acetyltransferase complex protein AlgI